MPKAAIADSVKRDCGAVQNGMFGNIAPARYRRVELLVAPVDFPGKVVAGAHLGDDVLADLTEGLQDGVVELQDFDGAFLAQLLQRKRIVRIELAKERAYSDAAAVSMSRRSLASKLSHTPLLMPTVLPALGS